MVDEGGTKSFFFNFLSKCAAGVVGAQTAGAMQSLDIPSHVLTYSWKIPMQKDELKHSETGLFCARLHSTALCSHIL